MDFPIYKTKRESLSQKFNVNDPVERFEYFQAKAGPEIEAIKEYIDEGHSFVAYMLAKKSAGKGTYSKMFEEIIGSDRVATFSIGDLIRQTEKDVADQGKRAELVEYLNNNYRGFNSVEEIMAAFDNRSTSKLLPTEFIMALVKREISKVGQKAVFIDGFPRGLDQISYSLYFREIMRLRDDPDFFVLIDVPESVIDARMKARVVCPLCKTSRSITLLPTKYPAYDKEKNRFYLICDNAECEGHAKQEMLTKEGDELGIEAIRDRVNTDQELINRAFMLQGISKVLLRNSVPVDQASEYVDTYEITPEFEYSFNDAENKVEMKEKPWVIKSDDGVESYSLYAAPVVLAMIMQIKKILLG